jgi:hypothetical protein
MIACLRYASAIMQQATQSTTPAARAESTRLLSVGLGHSKHLQNIEFMLCLVEARLEFYSRQHIRSHIRGADEIARQTLEDAVVQDLRSRGIQEKDWWTALQIEAFIRSEMGQGPYLKLQGWLSDKQGVVSQLVAVLTQSLAPKAVCFGNGPRWFAAHAAILTRTWVLTVNEIVV